MVTTKKAKFTVFPEITQPICSECSYLQHYPRDGIILCSKGTILEGPIHTRPAINGCLGIPSYLQKTMPGVKVRIRNNIEGSLKITEGKTRELQLVDSNLLLSIDTSTSSANFMIPEGYIWLLFGKTTTVVLSIHERMDWIFTL